MPIPAADGRGLAELTPKIIWMRGGGPATGAVRRTLAPNTSSKIASDDDDNGGTRGACAPQSSPKLFCQLPGLFRIEADALSDLLAETFKERRMQALAEALLLLSNEKALASSTSHYPQRIQDAVAAARKRLEAQDIDWRGAPIEWRYERIAEIQKAVTNEVSPPGETVSDKLDRVLTHKLWGTLIFIAVMAI